MRAARDDGRRRAAVLRSRVQQLFRAAECTCHMKVGLLAWPPPPMPAPMPRDATRCDSFASAELLHSGENKKRRQSVRGAYAVLGFEKRLCG